MPSKRKIVGLALEDGRWWRPSPVLLLRDAVGLGEEVVTVQERGALVEALAVPELEHLLLEERPLVGKRVLRADGSLLGWVADYAFDPRSGQITTLEVSPDSEGEATTPHLVAYQQVQVLGPDAVVVGESGRAQRQPAVAPSDAPAPGAEVVEETHSEAQATSPAAPGTTITGGDLARLFRERQERFLLGKVAQRAVLGREREIIVPAGTAVTPQILARAKESGKLLELTASVSARRDDTA
jgi:sporulation protein YlmC with PRC-barrel domain